MKKITFLTIIVTGLLIFGSCEDFLDVNQDPGSPSEDQMSESAYLPAVLAEATFKVGIFSKDIPYWIGQVSNNLNDVGTELFNIKPSDADEMWRIYYTSVKNSVLLLKKAEENNSYYYAGIAKTLLAFQFAMLTDYFNEIPAFDAASFPEVTLPEFDSQEEVYALVNQYLNDAIAEFQKTDLQKNTPGSDDLLFNGDIDLWSKFVNALKARYAMRLSYAPGRDKEEQADATLAALADALENNGDNAEFLYPGSAGAQNFWYQYQEAWLYGGYFAGYTIHDLMSSSNDPRMPVYFETNHEGNYVPLVNGTFAVWNDVAEKYTTSMVSSQIVAPDRSQLLMSFAECKFLEAEAYVLKGEWVNAEAAFQAGVRANMEYHGIGNSEITTFLSQFTFPTNEQDAQQLVIEQKYVANFLSDPEIWQDYRRTGYPVVDIENGFNNPKYNVVPVRFLYPETEILRNPNTPSNISIINDNVWWDAN